MATGSRATIYDKIDALSECASWEDACPKIQAILSNMAYYVVNSDGAILETHEEWHTDFTKRLQVGVGQRGSDSKKARTDGAVPIDGPVRKPKKLAKPAVPKSASRPEVESPPAKVRDADPLDDVPDSLKAIMRGTHPSLSQEEDDDGNFFERAKRSGKSSRR